MAAYHKVEVSLNTNAVEVGVPSPQTVNVVVPTIGPAGPTGSVGPAGPTGPQGVPGTGLEVLTTQGDLLYQGASTGQRLAIGTSGQVLKVANGIPAWGNESGAVTSVNGETGAVSLSAADVGAAAAAHTHDGTQVEIVADDATGPVLAAGFSEGSGVNGIYWPTDTTANALLVYKLNRTYGMFFEAGRWHIYELAPLSANIVVSSDLDDTDYPHQSNWPTGSVTKASLSNFGDNAAQQFRFVGDSMAVTDVTNAVSTSDSRLSDSRQPTLHGSTHHTGETDAIAAHQINGQTIFSVTSVNYSADQTLPANRARQITVSNTNASGITLTLPTQAEGTLNGDTYVIVGGSTMSGPITIRGVVNLSPLVYNTLVTITATGQQYRLRSGGGTSGNWSLIPVDTHTHTGSQVSVGTTANLPLKTGSGGVIEAGSFGTAAGSFCAGDDARLSDDRDPNLHAASHAAAGSDPIEADDLASSNSPATDDLLVSNGDGTTRWDSVTNVVSPNLAASDIGGALSGDITTSGLTQATARILGRTTASTGAVEEIQIGSGLSLSAGELSATGGSGVTAVGTTLADILSVSGSDLVADDLAADKLYGWDDSESKAIGFIIGSGLSVSGDTLSATASGGSKTYAVFVAGLENSPPSTAFATLDTRSSIPCLDFDDATDESAVFMGIIPEGASLGSGLKIRLHWMATTATSGNVVWDVSLERMTTDLDSDSFDTIASGTAAANGTSGILTVTEITLATIDSVTAGDGFRLKVTRDANNASDTMTGDAELIAVEVRSAA
jgi:hypothetical protein